MLKTILRHAGRPRPVMLDDEVWSSIMTTYRHAGSLLWSFNENGNSSSGTSDCLIIRMILLKFPPEAQISSSVGNFMDNCLNHKWFELPEGLKTIFGL